MLLFHTKHEMRCWSRQQRQLGKRIGLVPTMGYLHAGHMALIAEAKQSCDIIVVSIYVNPSQFAPHEDLSSYPRDLNGDICKLKTCGVDAVFNPPDLYDRGQASHSKDLDEAETEKNASNSIPVSYEKGHQTWVQVERLQLPMEGKSRPHFFRGVATVVTKLFNIVEPDLAVFGRKDYQQWRVLKRMVKDLDFDIEVVGLPLVREHDGLALSSRNVMLTAEQREQALAISRALMSAADFVKNGLTEGGPLLDSTRREIENAGGRVDYVELVNAETLQPIKQVDCPALLAVAAFYGSIRLIDNIEVSPVL